MVGSANLSGPTNSIQLRTLLTVVPSSNPSGEFSGIFPLNSPCFPRNHRQRTISTLTFIGDAFQRVEDFLCLCHRVMGCHAHMRMPQDVGNR